LFPKCAADSSSSSKRRLATHGTDLALRVPLGVEIKREAGCLLRFVDTQG
jgi:hypothetical protein